MKANVLHVDRKRFITGEESDDRDFEPYYLAKRSKVFSDIDAIGIIPARNAWPIDIHSILTELAQARPDPKVFNNSDSYDSNDSLIIICVQGLLRIHYDLLCNAIEKLVTLAPKVQIFLLKAGTQSVSKGGLIPPEESIGILEFSAARSTPNYFLKLGLLHPLGGGNEPLDAIVVLDANHRRRLIVPFGWGAGRHIFDAAGGRIVQERLMHALEAGLVELQNELKA